MREGKSATIEKISNGYTVELYTHREDDKGFGKVETVFADSLKSAFETITKFYA